MSRPRILSAVPQEAWDPARDPEEVHREPGDPARDPWDVGWLLEEKRPGRPQGPRVQPHVGWGSPTVAQDNPLDYHHHQQGTWSEEPVDTDGEDLGAGEEPGQEAEHSGQHTALALRSRSLCRSVVPPRPTRKIRGRPGYKAILIPWMYTPVLYQAPFSPQEWAKQTPVSGGTGLRLAPDYPLASTGWYDQLEQRGEGEPAAASWRQGTPPAFRRRTAIGCPRAGSTSESRSTEAGDCPRGGSTSEPRSREAGITCTSKGSTSIWEGEWTSWRTSPGLVTQTKQRSESHW